MAGILCMNWTTTPIYAEENNQTQTQENEGIQIPVATKYETDMAEGAISFLATVPVGGASVDIPMQTTNGGIVKIALSSEGLSQEVRVSLRSQGSEGVIPDNQVTLTTEARNGTLLVQVPQAGTYLLHVETAYTYVPITVNAKAMLYRNDNRTLQHKQWAVTYPNQYDTTNYYKVKLTKNGYITVQGRTYETTNGKLTVELCNNKKTSLNPKKVNLTEENEFTSYYALKKGTYYIKISDTDRPYKVRYMFTGMSDQAGTSKAKAKTLKKGKQGMGLLYLTDSKTKTDWFKVSLTKNQKLRMTITNFASTKLEYQILPASSNVTLHNAKFYPQNGTAIFVTGDTLPKGTYYIKISKTTTKDASGAYSIKV